ncbi:uncharacterized protein LOC110603090 isoform X3 [Manihot esculenta]|uniref:Uncharacterized protein n=1 Tax=Manihot esculenta TaxID=3983 RepID=A0ACB7G8P8_MANES|nr:uncharacterized protein LOC110603090 isoform X3 [Manihot esculenta]KAG8636391.1 hypothetical protein MANES_16G128200v8 [Manihot esculenta]
MSESECSRSICCPSPHRIVARWISGLRRTRVKRIPAEHVKKEKETESKMDEDEKGLGDRAVQARCSMNGLNGGNSVSTTGESRKDTSFNMGVGCCLLYLIAASKNELNKIVQMRLQMETLLQNTSEELINKSNISKLSKPNDMFAYSDTDSPQGPQFESQYIPESSTVSAVDQSLKCEPPEKEECSEEGMDQLEAELQAELERLQLHLDGEKLKHSELLRVEVTDEDTTCSKSQTTTSGEVIDLQPHDVDTDCGVPPDELEMETLLQNTSEELINKSNISKLSKPNDMFAYCDTDSPHGPQFESQYISESSTVSAVDQSLKCEPPEKEECSEEAMDQPEAELQAELERLQLHLDGEKLKHSELLRVEVTDEDTTCSKSQTTTSGEVIDLQPHDVDTDCGVPPNELEMETLLQNTSEELINKSNISKLSKPNDMFAYCDTDSPHGPQFESQYIPESSTVSAVDQSLKCEPPEKEECSEEAMDQLEAELQAELEHLQLHLDGEKLKHSELLRVEVTDEDTTCLKSQTTTSGEVIDLQPHDVDTDCGVPPDELERRLHELLEARQQEEIRELEAAIECLKHKLYEKEVEVSRWKDTAMRLHELLEARQQEEIRELEAAIECLKHKLYEKEVEVSRWKDTAMLISRHAMEPSPFTSRNDPKIITHR